MIKKSCNKCRRLNLLNFNINIEGSGKIKTQCKYCGHDIVFNGNNKMNIKVIEKEIKEELIEGNSIERQC